MRRLTSLSLAAAFLWMTGSLCSGQSRLRESPRYARYEKLARERANAFKSSSLAVKWSEDGKSLTYSRDGKKYRYDLAERRAVEITEQTTNAPAGSASEKTKEPRGTPPASRRHWTNTVSPDGKWEGVCRDRNVWLVSLAETNELAITQDGSGSSRIKYGSACWVYGEELEQKTAMWWSSNSQMLAFYRFDESEVPDYFLALNQTAIQNKLDVEPYTKAGGTNPVVDLFIYDLQRSNTV